MRKLKQAGLVYYLLIKAYNKYSLLSAAYQTYFDLKS